MSPQFPFIPPPQLLSTPFLQANMKEPLKEIRRALLEADVSLPVVKSFLDDVEKRSRGVEARPSAERKRHTHRRRRWLGHSAGGAPLPRPCESNHRPCPRQRRGSFSRRRLCLVLAHVSPPSLPNPLPNPYPGCLGRHSGAAAGESSPGRADGGP